MGPDEPIARLFPDTDLRCDACGADVVTVNLRAPWPENGHGKCLDRRQSGLLLLARCSAGLELEHYGVIMGSELRAAGL